MSQPTLPEVGPARFDPVTLQAMNEIAGLVNIGQTLNGACSSYKGAAGLDYGEVKRAARKVRENLRLAASALIEATFKTHGGQMGQPTLDRRRKAQLPYVEAAAQDMLSLVAIAERHPQPAGAAMRDILDRIRNVAEFWHYETSHADLGDTADSSD